MSAFRCGHPTTPENSRRVGWRADGSPKFGCIICIRICKQNSEAQRRSYRRIETPWIRKFYKEATP